MVGTAESSASFDNTNLIKDCTLKGAVGTGAINVTGGNSGVVIQNSYDDSAMPITTN